MANASGSIDISGNMTQVLPGLPAAAPAGGMEMTTIIALLIPLAIMAYILWWGMQKSKRKKTAFEVSYHLLAVEIIMVVLSPLCAHSLCLAGATLPAAMLIALLYFAYHHKKRERSYAADIAKAVAEGHVKPDSLMHKKFQEGMKEEQKRPLHHAVKHHVKKHVARIKERAKKVKIRKGPKASAPPQAPPARKHWLAKYAEGRSPAPEASSGTPKELPKEFAKEESPAAPAPQKQFTTPKWLTRSLESAPTKAPHERWSQRPVERAPPRSGPKEGERQAADHIIRSVLEKKSGEGGV